MRRELTGTIVAALILIGSIILFVTYDTLYLHMLNAPLGRSPLDWMFMPGQFPSNYMRTRMDLIFILFLITFIGLFYCVGLMVGLRSKMVALSTAFVVFSGVLDIAFLKSIYIPYDWITQGEDFINHIEFWLPIAAVFLLLTMLLLRWLFSHLMASQPERSEYNSTLHKLTVGLVVLSTLLSIFSMVVYARFLQLWRKVHHIVFTGRPGLVIFNGPQPYDHLLSIALISFIAGITCFLVSLVLSGLRKQVWLRDALVATSLTLLPGLLAYAANKSLSMYNNKLSMVLETKGAIPPYLPAIPPYLPAQWMMSYDFWRGVTIISALLLLTLFVQMASALRKNSSFLQNRGS